MNTRQFLAWTLAIGIAFAPLSAVDALGLPATDTTAPVISNITVSSVTPVGAVVAWTTDEVADAQIAYGTTTGYGSSTTLNVALGTAHVQTLTDLQAGTVYHYRVKSKDAAGNITVSADQTFTTGAVVETPSASSSSTSSVSTSSSSLSVEVSSTPSTQTDIITDPITTAASSSSESSTSLVINPDAYGPVISNVTISSITPVGGVIAWTTDEIADAQIEYGLTDVYGFETSLTVTLGTAHIQTLTDLEPGTAYHFRVKSKDAAGNVTISEDHIFTTESASIVIDTPPAILTQSVASVMPDSVTVLWTTGAIANSQIEYGLTTDYGLHTTLDASFALEHAVIVDRLAPGTEYHYRIKTTNSAGQITYSGDDTFMTERLVLTVEPSSSMSSALSVPLAVAEVQASALTSSSALIVWTTSTLADSQIEYGLTTSYGSHTTVDVSLGLAHAATLSGLAPDTTYHYRVKSRDAGGNLVSSDDQTFTTLATPPTSVSISTPPVISAVTVSTQTSSATITWTTDKLANAQVEYGRTNVYGSESTLNAAFATAHMVILSELEAGTTYHYRIRTTDAGGRLTIGDDETFTTAASASEASVTLPSLGDVETSALTASSALITWMTSVPTDAQIEYGPTTSYGSHGATDTSLSLEHTTLLSGLRPDTTYHYRVRSTDASGNHVLSADQSFTTLEPPSDQTAPMISGVTVTRTGTNSATITWTTDDASTTRVQYGETTAYGVYTDLATTPVTSHSATITGLFPDTTYDFNVQSRDSAGNTAVSVNHSFHTQTAPYTSGTMSVPIVSHVTDTSVTLSWTVPFDDTAGLEFYDIRYSTEPITQFNFESATPAREGVEHIVHVSENGQSTEHIYMVIELEAGTPYYFGIKSGASRSALAHLEETRADLSAESPRIESSVTESVQNNASGIGNVGGNQEARAGAGANAQNSNERSAKTQGISGRSGGRRLSAPRSIQAQAADREVAFVWRSPLRSPFMHTDIVRKEGSFPKSPSDGVTVYEGRDETFIDTNLTNGKNYHYAIYSHNDSTTAHVYSKPILVAMLPTEGIDQFDFLESVSGAPASASSSRPLGRDLATGSRGDDVKYLQQFLRDRGLYPIDVTGYFGSYTLAGVKAFQKQHGIPATGLVSTMTRAKMRE